MRLMGRKQNRRQETGNISRYCDEAWQCCLGLAILLGMSDVTRILSEIEQGDPTAAEKLLPLVYDELRKLALARLAAERPGQTLSATSLVHEAYIRLVDDNASLKWDSRGHF